MGRGLVACSFGAVLVGLLAFRLAPRQPSQCLPRIPLRHQDAPLSSRQCRFSIAACSLLGRASVRLPAISRRLPTSRAGNRLAVESQGGTATVGLPAVCSGALAGGHHRLRPRASRSSRLSSASCSECRGAYSSLHLLPGPPSR